MSVFKEKINTKIDYSFKKFEKISALLVLILCFTRTLKFYLGPISELITIVPDDTFYMIEIAKNGATPNRTWSFDGQSVTTGFQYLSVKLLSIIFRFGFPSDNFQNLFLVISILGSISLGFSCLITIRLTRTLYGETPSLIAALLFFGNLVISQSTLMLESWLAILIYALTVNYYFTNREKWSITVFAGFVLGCLGGLVRTEYAIFALTYAFMFTFSRRLIAKKIVTKAYSLLLGCVIANSFLAISRFRSVGRIAPDSAIIKKYWSDHYPSHQIEPLKFLSLNVFPSGIIEIFNFPLRRLMIIVFTIFILLRIMILIYQKKLLIDKSSYEIYSYSACVVLILNLVLYSFNRSSIQPWYSANLIIPLVFIIGFLTNKLSVSNKLITILLFVCALLISVNQLFKPIWPWQGGMLVAAKNLEKLEINEPIGAWNAGIFKYFSGKQIINIDGLVNSEAVPYILGNNLEGYLKEKKIRFLIDYELMLTDPVKRYTMGYNSDFWLECVEKKSKLDETSPAFFGSHIFLYNVKQDCLNS